ncbi:hypothetical protein EKO04_009403 [Ascochyta lentis]|uniref:Uncharacterized protein n=1 Tax=Ascochyta lentis TaxID=205686 RepID=A0A8H7IVM7_9PLEO|nr:hypothetical protein EKO04_009403 [Ascochyta lentis]
MYMAEGQRSNSKAQDQASQTRLLATSEALACLQLDFIAIGRSFGDFCIGNWSTVDPYSYPPATASLVLYARAPPPSSLSALPQALAVPSTVLPLPLLLNWLLLLAEHETVW